MKFPLLLEVLRTFYIFQKTYSNCFVCNVIGIFRLPSISQEIDLKVVKKINELVNEGVSNVNEMRRHLRIFVKSTLFGDSDQPDPTNRRYFPRPKTIRSHIVDSKRKMRYSMIDQECLDVKVQQWRSEDPAADLMFRPKSKSDCMDDTCVDEDDIEDDDFCDVKVLHNNHNQLLFVYQTRWQRRLLERYGNELALLDATYRTTRYALHLFSLVIKTNLDYQVAAIFVCEGESTDIIAEALTIIQKWDPNFIPRFFMTDYSNEEIAAIEQVFPGMSRITELTKHIQY